jgi:hypothetical protein
MTIEQELFVMFLEHPHENVPRNPSCQPRLSTVVWLERVAEESHRDQRKGCRDA